MIHNKEITCPFCNLKYPARTNYTDKRFNEQSSHQIEVEKAMRFANQELPQIPTIPSLEIRRLRAKLILEEALETIQALGLELIIDGDPFLSIHETIGVDDAPWKPNLKEIVDGCCDLRVVTTGTLSACGIKDVVPQELVDENNLKKFSWTKEEILEACKNADRIINIYPSHQLITNKAGKYIKPPSHKPPLLQEEIERQSKLI